MKSFSATALQQYRMEQASSVRLPYLGIGLTLVLLAISFAVLKMPTMDFTRDIRPGELDADLTATAYGSIRCCWLGRWGSLCMWGRRFRLGAFW